MKLDEVDSTSAVEFSGINGVNGDLVYGLSRKIFWFAGDAINIWSSLQRDRSPPISYLPTGFATGVENMGGSSKFDGGNLSQYMGGAWGGLKFCQKIPVKEFI